MAEKEVVVYKGLSFGTMLFLVFLVLKLCGVINWSWWWVTAPLWISWAILLGIVVVVLIIIFFIAIIAGIVKVFSA